MNSKWLLSASAAATGALGVTGLFAPDEVMAWAGVHPDRLLSVLIQLLGSVMLGFAVANWTARGSLIGGIYNRPIAFGNLMHFTVGALVLTKAAMGPERGVVLVGLAVLYVAFAIAFAGVFFRSPVRSEVRAATPDDS